MEFTMSFSHEQEHSFLRYLETARKIRDVVNHPRVAFAGKRGAYAEVAAKQFFGDTASIIPHASFEDVFKSITGGGADYGVLPIENSSTGAIAAVYDLFARYRAVIVGETAVAIRHCLMALPDASLDTIKNVYSHEQGFYQSREYLSAHPGWQCVPYHNTAVAAHMVAKSGDLSFAAIAGRQAAELYGLNILAENINSSDVNTTRFVIISPMPEIRPGANKISIAFTLPHTRGVLYRLLGIFAEQGLNLCKIESRPLPDAPWEYRFYLDFLTDPSDAYDAENETAESEEDVIAYMDLLRRVIAETGSFDYLGYYPSGT